MPSVIARLHQPVVRLIGRRLAASETPEAMRRTIGVAGRLMAPASRVKRSADTLGTREGLRIAPTGDHVADRSILYFHGGGYVFGSPKMYAGLAGRLAKVADATAYVPSYRLAPEFPCPAAIDDGLEAYRALIERVPHDRLAVGGDSAGGGLTVAVLQAARSEDLPMPACAFLISPWLDLTATSPTHRSNEPTEMLIRPESIDRASGFYLGDLAADDERASPLFGDLSGLPPTLVQVSDNELLLADSQAFRDRAGASGVDVELRVERSLWHVWHLMAPAVPEARASIAQIADHVRRHTQN